MGKQKAPSQKDMIAAYMVTHGTITPMEAFRKLGVTKLSTRIGEMKKDGYKINIGTVYRKNRNGKMVTFGPYSFTKGEQQ